MSKAISLRRLISVYIIREWYGGVFDVHSRLIGPLFGDPRVGGRPLEKQMEREDGLLESIFEDPGPGYDLGLLNEINLIFGMIEFQIGNPV